VEFEEFQEDENAKDAFINKNERIMYKMNSDKSEIIQTIFWDERPLPHENLHSTMQYA